MSLFEAGYFITLQDYHNFILDCLNINNIKNFSMINSLRKIVILTVEEDYKDNYFRLAAYEYDLFLHFSFVNLEEKHVKLFFFQFLQYQNSRLSEFIDNLMLQQLSRPNTPVVGVKILDQVTD